MEAIERDRKRQSDGDDSRVVGRRGQMDGAASGARYSSKRAGTRLVAEYQASRHGRYERNTSDIPRPSTPFPGDFGHTDHPNSPRCRGRIKPRELEVSATQEDLPGDTGVSGPIERIEPIGRVVYGPEITQERPQGAICEDGGVGVDRGRARALRQRDHSRAATFQIGQPRQRSATRPHWTHYGVHTIHSFYKPSSILSFISILYPLGQTLKSSLHIPL